MKKFTVIFGVALILLFFAFLRIKGSGNYHLREFEILKTNYNTYQPTMLDYVMGIHDTHDKWEYHLRKLQELGVVQHKNLVFTEVPYTRESSKRIWGLVYSNFPNAVMVTGTYLDTNNPGYGVNPCTLNVWDLPREMPRWSSFFQTNNCLQ